MVSAGRLASPDRSGLLEPAAPMPVTAQVGRLFRRNYEVAFANGDRAVTPRAAVRLAGGVRLHHGNDLYPQRAHSTTMIVRTSAPTTMTMSAKLRS